MRLLSHHNLSVDEENKTVNRILSNAKVGFPVHPEQVKDSIQSVLKNHPIKIILLTIHG